MIRVVTVGIAAVFATSGAASAVDWSGAYFGLFGSQNGGTIATTDLNTTVFAPFQIVDIEQSGFSAGILSGYNWQRGNLVFGFEADVQAGGGSGSSLVDPIFLDETLTWKMDHVATVRGRVGFARNNLLFYATAGFASAKATFGYLNYDDTLTVIEADSRSSQTLNGTVLGLGVEMSISANATLRLEYLQHDFGSAVSEVSPGFAPIDYKPTTNSVRAAFVWNF